MAQKITVSEMLSDVDNYSKLEMSLWLTPGSSNPYWDSSASFAHDVVVASPWDFLEAAGYDAFDEEADYEECDEEIEIEVELVPYPYIE